MKTTIDTSTKDSILLQCGMAEKAYGDMSPEEKKIAAAVAFQRAKDAAFPLGLPIIIGKNGLVIAEYEDGRRFIRENGIDIRPFNG